jgi:diguanylate cyclase (GGDEF)-like protein
MARNVVDPYGSALSRPLGGVLAFGALVAFTERALSSHGLTGELALALAALGMTGLALFRWPVSGPLLTKLVPLVGAPLIAFGMVEIDPGVAPWGIPYLAWLVALAGVFQGKRGTLLTAAWCVGCALAWSAFAPGRELLSDGIYAVATLGATALGSYHLARELRRSHSTLDTARRDAEVLSRTDTLTGLANRRAFDAEAQLRAVEARLGGILMIDIDRFKHVNDEYGHDAGDQVLQEVARRLNTAIRGADFGARLGGDEFAVLLEGPLTMDGLRRVADAVRGATSSFAAVTSAGQVRISTSVGGALVLPAAAVEQQARSTRSRADNALYQAKRAGRDRAILDGELRAPSARRGRRARSGPRAA